ncbi:hypothetical protein EDB81DRAFT_61507 [Dactylonectria macrodidyma]|uniref:Uncharacterized protein n=1 Tax=Dactylonectria macrodidyma TaxID=307937 RepID=A0A9P9EN21_9HYPO|nr:hypothetical protein EDB81DRAFT_61507 [Dactylonectria macrodidyma]
MATASVAFVPTPQRTNSDNVSPKTTVPRGSKDEYFLSDATVDGDESSAHKSSISFAADPPTAHSSSLDSTEDDASTKVNEGRPRQVSISFQRPRNPSLPQGNPQHTTGSRIRASSPPHQR